MDDTDATLKTNSGWLKPTKHVPITHFYKNNEETNKNENVNDNRHDIFTDDTEIDEEQNEDAGKILMKEFNNKGEEVNKKKKRKSTC